MVNYEYWTLNIDIDCKTLKGEHWTFIIEDLTVNTVRHWTMNNKRSTFYIDFKIKFVSIKKFTFHIENWTMNL